MNEYDDWSPAEETDTSHIDLRRHVCLSGRFYELSACGGGYDPVAVRLTGRNAEGYLVTDLRGDVLPQDLVDVADLLQATLEGVATATRRDERWQAGIVPDPDWAGRPWPPLPDLPPDAGATWTDDDLARLVERHRGGATIEELMEEFGRSDAGIRSRLQLLGESLPGRRDDHEPDAAEGVGPEGVGPDSVGPDSAGPDSAGPDSAGPDSAGPDSFIYEADDDDVDHLLMEAVA